MKNFYCPLPFKHVFLEPRGAKPCCSYTKMYEGSIEDWLDSEQLTQLQQLVLAGEVPDGCKSCIQGEIKDGTSTRLGALRDYAGLRATNTSIDYVDYRASNVCNFKCRSCDPYYSYKIAKEAQKNPQLIEFYPVPENKFVPTTTKDKQWIVDNLHNIKRLMFTGGEPTRIKEVREIIDIILEKNIKHIDIQMITNGSFTDPFWFEFTKTYPRIHWAVSIDAVGKAAELIRDGTDWQLVDSNTRTLFDISPSVNIGTVITNLNVKQLGSLFDYANDLYHTFDNRQNGRTHLVEVCNWPAHMSPYNWPDDRKMEILRSLNSIKQDSLQPKQKQIVQTIFKTVAGNKFDQNLWNTSVKYNHLLDQIRDQDHTKL